MRVGHLVLLLGAYVASTVALVFGVLYVVTGWRLGDLRDVVLHDAYYTFTFEGQLIPGAKPGFFARTAIRLLSDDDDGRLDMVPELRRVRRLPPAIDFERVRVVEVSLRRLCDGVCRAH